MKFTFNANCDSSMGCTLEDGGHISIETKENGDVTIEYKPLYTSGYLRTDFDSDSFTYTDMPDFTTCKCYCGAQTTAASTDFEPEKEDEEGETEFELNLNDEDEAVDNKTDETCYKLAEKIAKYDKDGTITSIITSLIDSNDESTAKTAATISKMMCNLSDKLKELNEELF